MKNFSERCIMYKEHSNTPFDLDKHLDDFSWLYQTTDRSKTWIRSGIHIPTKYKNIISSYRLLAQCSSASGASAEILAVKGQVGIKTEEHEKECLSFLCDYMAHTQADMATAVFTSSGSDGCTVFIARSPRFASFSVPNHILSFMCIESVKNYLHHACSLTKSALDGYFSPTYLLYDDSVIRSRAKAIDTALRDLKFCDIACASGSVAKAMCSCVVSARMSLNRYLENTNGRTEDNFTSAFIGNSLYVSDSDVGATETLRAELRLSSFGGTVAEGHFAHGSILTEDLFSATEFDIIISNPPHMRQELFSSMKSALKSYKSAETASDLYCYYIERGMSLLNKYGTLAILTSNRWMRASYGVPVRELLASSELVDVVDYVNRHPISEFNNPVSVVVAGKSEKGDNTVNFIAADEDDIDDLASYAAEHSKLVDHSRFGSDKWILNNGEISDLLAKLEDISLPLSRYVNGKVYRGILTGLNEAFIVDAKDAESFIAANAANSLILRPFLSGRSVKRYLKPEASKYLIFIPKGYTDKMRGDMPPLEWLATTHREIAMHLAKYEERASKRSDKGTYWWELRSCKYYDEFESTKIICPSIVKHLSAAMDSDGLYSNDKTVIVGTDDYFLLGLLNSSLADFYFRKSSNELLNDHFELKPGILGNIPIRKISPTNSRHLRLRDEIASAAKELCAIYQNSPSKNASVLTPERIKTERALNNFVFQLYKLTPSEISLVENY